MSSFRRLENARFEFNHRIKHTIPINQREDDPPRLNRFAASKVMGPGEMLLAAARRTPIRWSAAHKAHTKEEEERRKRGPCTIRRTFGVFHFIYLCQHRRFGAVSMSTRQQFLRIVFAPHELTQFVGKIVYTAISKRKR